jgi:hypothetical protein
MQHKNTLNIITDLQDLHIEEIQEYVPSIYLIFTHTNKKRHHYNTNYINQNTTKQCIAIENITYIVLSQNYFRCNNEYYKEKKD